MTRATIRVPCPDCREGAWITRGWNHVYDVCCPNGHVSKVELFEDDPDRHIDVARGII